MGKRRIRKASSFRTVLNDDAFLENAYIICDGKEIPLGAKTDAGTLPDKGFTIGWLTKTVIDPGKVTAICVDGKIIDID